MAVRPKAWVSSLLIAEIAGSNPTEGMDVRPFCLLCVLLRSGFCEEMITSLEEPYCLCVCVCVCVCLIVCDIATSTMMHPMPHLSCWTTENTL
jgi:hypothetical protein